MPVGPSPFAPGWSDWYRRKRHNKNARQYRRDVGANPPLEGGYETRDVRGILTGDVYKLPKQDYERLVGYFNEHRSELSQQYTADGKQLYRNIQTPGDLIDFALDKKSQQKRLETVECRGGHIKSLTYNSYYKVLKVEFTNRGDTVVFFELPANVAAELMLFGRDNVMAVSRRDGTERHMVGVRFWDLVRVRGTVHVTRYPFQYTVDNRTGGAFGRKAGTGMTGEGNLWEYTPNESGTGVIRTPTPLNKAFRRRDDTAAERAVNEFERKADIVDTWEIDDLDTALERAGLSLDPDDTTAFDGAMRKMTTEQRVNMRKARDMYNSADPSKSDDIGGIATLLLRAGVDLGI